jgi:Family of unknown function (DUF6790)
VGHGSSRAYLRRDERARRNLSVPLPTHKYPLYLAAVLLTLFVLPAVSVVIEALLQPGAAPLMVLIGKWFTFWVVGVRLFLAGAMQRFRPQFTAVSIFAIKDMSALAIVREVGFGNLAMGTLGLLSLAYPDWVVPAAIVGGLFCGLAGIGQQWVSARASTLAR